jgi:hypothetical protein
LGERLPYKQEVAGSIPAPPTTESPVNAGLSFSSQATARARAAERAAFRSPHGREATGQRRTLGGLLPIAVREVVTQALVAAPVVVHVSTHLSTWEKVVAILAAVGGVAAGVGCGQRGLLVARGTP